MTPIEALRARWSGKYEDLNPTFATVASFFAAASTKKAALSAGGRLTEAGVNAEVLAWAEKGFVKDLRRAEKFVSDQRALLAERRRKLSEPQIDRTDAIAAAQRREVRDYLRSLPLGERANLVIEADADPIFAVAALELPQLAGLDAGLLDHARKAYAERTAGDVLKQIAERAEALDALGALVEVVKSDTRSEIRPEGQSFDSWFSGLE